MPIANQESWDKWVASNTDGYGGACVAVARNAMRLLDEGFELKEPNDTHKLICQADDQGGITGFMAGAAASMISQCHSRGDEFRRLWNRNNQIGDEGERANDSGGVLNPALLNIG